MNVGILEYGAGNLRSVVVALRRLGVTPIISSDPEQLNLQERIIFPGVGSAAPAMQSLRDKGLDDFLVHYKKPLLGICLGLQLLCQFTEEGDTPGLSIFPQCVRRFQGSGKIPHVGWNQVTFSNSPLFAGLEESAYFYFVHSYRADSSSDSAASCDYLGSFSAALSRDNFFAVQFHPEKSGEIGERVLHNFLRI